jgi:tetratricopeptide (TPR) repeat protein
MGKLKAQNGILSDTPPMKGEYEKLWDKLTDDLGLSAMFWLFLGTILLIFSPDNSWCFDIPRVGYIKVYRAWLGLACFLLAGIGILWNKPKAQRAAQHNESGVVYCKKKQYGKAIREFDKALKIRQDYAEAYSNRGTTHYRKDKYDKAIADYTAALDIKKDDPRCSQ